MNKKELISKVSDVLRANDTRKKVTAHKTVFHITDDHGNHTDFTIKRDERGLVYTVRDVTAIIETCLAVIEDSIRNGEKVSIQGFGVLDLNLRAARSTRHPDTGEFIEIKERYVPKFTYGNDLRVAARAYEDSIRKSGVVK